ncbi:hypothetical protein DICPUDRAFT_78913 [Dictyostelium purpureum]|uniref:AMP-dependent synthetase/ligase domain-containing protein n=1 Tax=Dictyostelium purpureum TaxID=5786 RepID=F0ZKZ5_DICPU|nr:uncharacterized protein DICPUDRAFT_78913 [Dictyostelium purpureum]EGC35369.1 hypothetical protein DICPUDRAFT_78913 [Dictyostelium purpureum]|eukprot:XP_003288107.1 hypothetical protein DICPUDRAFT_78913 [Dictyostelium purpureum]
MKYNLSEPFSYYEDLEFSKKENPMFWDEVSKKYKIHWDKPYDEVLNFNIETKKSQWFKGGFINACYNALDKNIINGKGNEVAFIHELPIKSLKFTITYQELYDKVCKFSRSLKNLGVKKGDVVLIYMHNSFETIISMLSCARIGAIHSVMYGGALSDNLSSTITDCKPKIIISSSFSYFLTEEPKFFLPILKEALCKSLHKPSNVVIYNRKDIPNIDYNDHRLKNCFIEGSLDWNEIIENVEPYYEYEPVESQHPLYLIYSSGTTNKPKGIVRETGGHIVALNYTTRMNYKLADGETYYSGASFGWISSHSFLIYGMLFVGGKSPFLEGPFKSFPEDFWRLISSNKVNVFLITPLITRLMRKQDPEGKIVSKFDLSAVKFVSICGERVHQSIIDYLLKITKKPVLSEYWQTESGWQMTLNPLDQFPIRGDSIGKAVIGYQLKVVTNSKTTPNKVIELGPNEIGEIVIKLPLPPCATNSLFGDDEKSSLYNKHYLNKYEGYFSTGDLGYYDLDGYYFYVSRSGDSITCGNSNINCDVVECDILNNPQINECCIVGIKDEVLTQTPLVLLVINNEENKLQIMNYVSNHLINIIHTNTVIKPIILCVNGLPRNRNGKLLKPLVKSIFNGENYVIPPTMDNYTIIDELLEEYNKLIIKN